MKKFMDENFLLNTNTAEFIPSVCKGPSIYDYHCHLNPKKFENKPYENITQMWLAGDHYKWRLCSNRVDENTLPAMPTTANLKNLLNVCSMRRAIHLPLVPSGASKVFGVYEVLTAENTKLIWDRCTKKYTPKLIEMSMLSLCAPRTTVGHLGIPPKAKIPLQKFCPPSDRTKS